MVLPGAEGGGLAWSLLRLARQVTARHDIDDVLGEAFRCLRPMVPFGGGSIQLLDDEGWIAMAACDPVAPPHVREQRVPLGGSVAGRVILTESPVYLPDLEQRTDDDGNRVSTGVRSYLGLPLVADGRAIGLLQVDSPEADAWTEEQRGILASAAPIVAAAIQNARAHSRAAEARQRSEALDSRLRAAQQAVATARIAARAGDTGEVERQLARVEAALAADSDGTVVQLPVQRAMTAADVR